MAMAAARGKLIAVIGDEDTCVGFVLGGIGEVNRNRMANFTVVDKNTSIAEIEESFRGFLKRDDIAIILINQNIAEMIRHVIDSHELPIPAVLEIPSKDCPYDPSKDSILRRAKDYDVHDSPAAAFSVSGFSASESSTVTFSVLLYFDVVLTLYLPTGWV